MQKEIKEKGEEEKRMKTLGIVGCGHLGSIVAKAWKEGLLPDYELIGVAREVKSLQNDWQKRQDADLVPV